MQIDVFVKNSSGVAMSEISLVNFNLQLILSLEWNLGEICLAVKESIYGY